MELPTSKFTFDELPTDDEHLREALVDLFGQHLMSIRNQRLATTVECVADPARAGRGAFQREEFERVAALDAPSQQAALDLTAKTIDLLLEDLLALLGHQGYGLRLGDQHCVRYNLVLQVLRNQVQGTADETEYGVLARAVSLNQEPTEKHFGDYLGRWRNRHTNHR